MPVFTVTIESLRKRESCKWTRFEPDVLPMFVAEMDADMAEPVRQRLERALRDGDTGYPGAPVYQEAFADFAAWRWGWRIGAGDAQVATDVVTAMRDAIAALTKPGDSVVINSPIYPPFRTVVASTGRRILDVPMSGMSGRELDMAALEAAFSQHRPAAYLLCSPHNPTGAVYARAELEELARLSAEYNVVVISDEIHAPLCAQHVPWLDVAGADGLVVTSASKSWNLAAAKAALIVGEASLRARLSPVLADGASFFGILAHATALSEARDWLVEASAEIALNKALLAEAIAARLPQLRYDPSPGTYLAWLDCSALGLADPGHHFHTVGRVRLGHGADFAPDATQFVRINVATSPQLVEECVGRMAASVDR